MFTDETTATTSWTTTDELFFRIVDGAFTATFVEGASALLASYDVDATSAAAEHDPVSLPLRISPSRAVVTEGLR
ncbi:MAG: hypothetical protein JWO22_321 [Frankiales bacterium]|nr:hypothetical protein [Frankiales bacterium]